MSKAARMQDKPGLTTSDINGRFNEFLTARRLCLGMRSEQNSGFTLIELSIVLVIIGLIVGGILIGQDLIEASKMRGTITQMEQFDTAVNTFRLKYRYIPGDMLASRAGQLGFFQLTSGYGNANGQFEPVGGGCSNEALVFWRHLSDAQLIEGSYGSQGNNAIDPASGNVTANAEDPFLSMPAGKIGRGSYFYPVTPTAGGHRYLLRRMNSLLTIGLCVGMSNNTLTPIEAHSIDSKVDDGKFNTGRIIGAGNWDAGESAGFCLTGGAGDWDPTARYNTSSSGQNPGNVPSCFITREFGL
jgi:prepilin-type N-terminal cleavage/methylation domain-containing protein